MPSNRALLLAVLFSALAAAGAGLYTHTKNKETRIPASPELAVAPAVAAEPSQVVEPPATHAIEEKTVTWKPAQALPAATKKIETKSAELKPQLKPAEEESSEEAQPNDSAPLDLAEEIQEERKDEPAGFHPDAGPNILTEKKMAADPEPVKAEVSADSTDQNSTPALAQPSDASPADQAPAEPALNVETETKVTVKLPEQPKPEEPAAAVDNPAPALPPSEPETKPALTDFIYFSPKLGYQSVKTNRASNGQLIQLGTKLSPSFSLGLKQQWSDGMALFAEGSAGRYSFNDISGVNGRNLSGTSYSAKLGAEFEQTKHLALAFYAGLGQNFAVDVDSSNVIEPVSYTRPEAGMELNIKLHKFETGSISLKPRAAYAMPGARNSEKSKGHVEYGVKLGFERISPATLRGTGAELEFTKNKFKSTQGSTTESSLGIGLNFSLGF